MADRTCLKEDGEYAGEQDDEEQYVAKLGACLEIDAPITPKNKEK